MIWNVARFKVFMLGLCLVMLGIGSVIFGLGSLINYGYFNTFETFVVLSIVGFEVFGGLFFIYWGTEPFWFDIKWGKDARCRGWM